MKKLFIFGILTMNISRPIHGMFVHHTVRRLARPTHVTCHPLLKSQIQRRSFSQKTKETLQTITLSVSGLVQSYYLLSLYKENHQLQESLKETLIEKIKLEIELENKKKNN